MQERSLGQFRGGDGDGYEGPPTQGFSAHFPEGSKLSRPGTGGHKAQWLRAQLWNQQTPGADPDSAPFRQGPSAMQDTASQSLHPSLMRTPRVALTLPLCTQCLVSSRLLVTNGTGLPSFLRPLVWDNRPCLTWGGTEAGSGRAKYKEALALRGHVPPWT